MQKYEKYQELQVIMPNSDIYYYKIDTSKFTADDLQMGEELVRFLCSREMSYITLAFQLNEGLQNPYFNEYFSMIIDNYPLLSYNEWRKVKNHNNLSIEDFARYFYNITSYMSIVIGDYFFSKKGILFDYSFLTFKKLIVELNIITQKLEFNINKTDATQIVLKGDMEHNLLNSILIKYASQERFGVMQNNELYSFFRRNEYNRFVNIQDFLKGFENLEVLEFSGLLVDCKDIEKTVCNELRFTNCIILNVCSLSNDLVHVDFTNCLFIDDAVTPEYNSYHPFYKYPSSFYNFLDKDFKNDISIRLGGNTNWIAVFNTYNVMLTVKFFTQITPKNEIHIAIDSRTHIIPSYKTLQDMLEMPKPNQNIFVFID